MHAVAVRKVGHDVESAWKNYLFHCEQMNPHIYHAARRSFYNTRPGDNALIIRKHGGVGDVIIVSQVLNELHKHYPEVQLYFCVPLCFHDMFRNVPWLKLVDYDKHSIQVPHARGGMVNPKFSQQFDIVEDVTTPCHSHEQIFTLWDCDNGPIQWQNRFFMWLSAISPLGRKDVTEVKSCIHIEPAELTKAKVQYKLPEQKLALICPVGSFEAKDFIWHRELCQMLAKHYNIRLLGDPRKIKNPKVPVVHTRTLRDYICVVGCADLTITIDSAALHACGILGKPCFGLFNINNGKTYSEFYPTVRVIQLCDTPCIANLYGHCRRKATTAGDHTCYPSSSLDIIEKTLQQEGFIK